MHLKSEHSFNISVQDMFTNPKSARNSMNAFLRIEVLFLENACISEPYSELWNF